MTFTAEVQAIIDRFTAIAGDINEGVTCPDFEVFEAAQDELYDELDKNDIDFDIICEIEEYLGF